MATAYPSRGLFVHSISDLDPAFSEAIARAYNDWLADFCRDGDPRRMYGAAMLRVHQGVCYRGLEKNTHRLVVTCALANLLMVRKRLLRLQEA